MRWRVIAAAIVFVSVLIGAGVYLRPTNGVGNTAAAAPPPPPPSTTTVPPTTTTVPETTTTTVPPPVTEPAVPCEPQSGPTHGFEGAKATVPTVALYDNPSATQPFDTMANPTSEGVLLVFSVKEHGPEGWLHVQYSRRPNESTAWIHAKDVEVTPVANRIVIQRASHRLTVFDGSSCGVVFQAPVAVGTSGTPTPLGDFFIDIVLHLPSAGGAYGPYQLSVAAFSDVLRHFDGGSGQIAIHGTNQPQLIGGAVSHGCVRMRNADVSQVAELINLGSPVSIVDT